MFRCEDCGRFFSEPIIEHDDPSPSGVSLASGYYTEWYCPHCGSDLVEEAGYCKSCGEPVESGTTLCENCREDLFLELRDIAEEMKLDQIDFADAVTEVIETLFRDGRW